MQSKTISALLISAAALTSVAAHAEGGKVWGFDQIGNATSVSTKTRAEVKTELLQAQREGFSTASNFKDYPATPSKSLKSRAQVRSELAQAQAEGTSVIYQH